jgi:hypothetical protein
MRPGLQITVLAWLALHWAAIARAADPPARSGFAAAPSAPPPTFAPAPPAATTPAGADPDPLAAPPLQTPPPQPPAPAAGAPPDATVPAPAAPPGSELPPPSFAPPPAPPAPLPPLRRRAYGDAGSTEVSLALGYTQQTGFFGGGGFRRFVIDGVGPGIEGSIQKASDQPTTSLVLASLKLVPYRSDVAALILTGRAGRVFLADHDDGWGVGGAAGVIFFVSPGVGLEIGYAILWLRPSHFCADLVSCRVEGPELGLRVSF